MLSVLIRILMSTNNIQFHDKTRTFSLIFVFMSYLKNFVGTQKEFELAMVNKPSVFELLRFDCIYLNCTVNFNLGCQRAS